MRGARRSSGRRPDSASGIPRHGPVLRFRLASLVAAQMFDFGTFTVMVGRHGIDSEANPLVANGLALFGMPVVAILKAALVILLAAIVVLLDRGRTTRRRFPRLAATIAVLAVLGGLIGGIANVLAT
jgi:hypothetical protein